MPYLTPKERLGTVVAERYRVDRVIGRGGMGVVFHAVHTWTDREVALKVLLPQFVDDEEVVARFLQEAKAAASLRSRNVVDVLDMGHAEDGSVYLALELLDGGTLGSLLTGDPLPTTVTFGMLLPLVDALAAAHDKGIVHRDLKPDNIFIARTADGGWIPKLLDFGIAKLAQHSDVATGTGVVLGTPRYMAPEQASGDPVGPAADVWAMGVIAYECLSGSTPFDNDSHVQLLFRLVSEDVPSLATLREELDAGIVKAIDKALVRDPAERWPDARAFVDALAGAVRAAGNVPSLDAVDELMGAARALEPTSAPKVPERPPATETPTRAVSRPSSPGPAATGTTPSSGTRRKTARVTVVRPYGKRIRDKVFPLFEKAGLSIEPEDVIAPKTSDIEAIRLVRASSNAILLVPFHGHKDADGNRVDGLAFVRQLHASSSKFRWKVIMPVSAFARASVTLALGGGKVPSDLERHILFLYDDELDQPGQAQRVRDHVAELARRSWSGA